MTMEGKSPNSIQVNKRKSGDNKNSNKSSSELFASCSFSSLGLHPTLCEELKERLGFEVPTLVQAQAIPVILSGKHVLVNAATGTGKTVAYLAPVIHHLQQFDPRVQRSDGTFGEIFITLEYELQQLLVVYEIMQKLLHRFHWIVPGYIMGGENRSKEKARLRKGITILVATPGRLLDHLKNTSSFLHANLRWIIFDEADRILELGFGKDIEEILDILGSRQQRSFSEEHASSRIFKGQRQNLLLSATLNEKVNQLANISLENPIMIGLGGKKMQIKPCHEDVSTVESNMDDGLGQSCKTPSSSDEEYKLPAQLVQRYIKVSCGSRLVVLLSILKHLFEREASQKVVVFFATRDTVDFHYSLVNEFQGLLNSQSEAESQQTFLSCKTFRLHGEMEHVDRRTTFQAFKTEKSALLLSTDVAARGLDFPKVRCILQYDPPGEATEYVHRVGRTARLGERGDSFLFLQPVEIDYLQDLEKHGIILTEYPLLKLLDGFPFYGLKHNIKKFVSVEVHPWVVAVQKALEAFISMEAFAKARLVQRMSSGVCVLNRFEPTMKNLAKNAFSSWVRAYTAHRGELKRIFVVKKLHLGHVAKSFGLKEQPSLVNKSMHKLSKKRKRNQLQKGTSKRRMLVKKS